MGLQTSVSQSGIADEKPSAPIQDKDLTLPKIPSANNLPKGEKVNLVEQHIPDFKRTEYIEEVLALLEDPEIKRQCLQLKESPSQENLQRVLQSLYENSDLQYDLPGWDGNAIDVYGILSEEFNHKQTSCRVTSLRAAEITDLLIDKRYLPQGTTRDAIEMSNPGHTALAVSFNKSEPAIVIDPWISMGGKPLPVLASRSEWEKEVHSYNHKTISEKAEMRTSFSAKTSSDRNWISDRNNGKESKIPGGDLGSPERKADYLVYKLFIERHKSNPDGEAKSVLPHDAMDPDFFRETRDRMVFMLKNEGLIDELRSQEYRKIDSFKNLSPVTSAYFKHFYKDSNRIKEITAYLTFDK